MSLLSQVCPWWLPISWHEVTAKTRCKSLSLQQFWERQPRRGTVQSCPGKAVPRKPYLRQDSLADTWLALRRKWNLEQLKNQLKLSENVRGSNTERPVLVLVIIKHKYGFISSKKKCHLVFIQISLSHFRQCNNWVQNFSFSDKDYPLWLMSLGSNEKSHEVISSLPKVLEFLTQLWREKLMCGIFLLKWQLSFTTYESDRHF